MGLFDLFKTKDTAFFLSKSDKAIANQDLGEALLYVRKAIQFAEKNANNSALETAKAREVELKRRIYDLALTQAKQYLRSGQKDAAQNAIERASRYVQNDEERDELNNIVESADHWQEEEQVVEAHVEGEERVNTLDDDDKWNLYVTSLTFEKAEHCDRLGKDFKKALLALQEGAYDEAIEGLEKVYHANEENENDIYIMCQLGQAYMGKREVQKADEILEKADRTEDDIETKLLRVQILWALKKFETAETVLQSAHDMDPENAQVLATIAQHGLISKDFESGIAAIEVLLESIPNDISVQRLAGRLYMESGDDDKALACFETVNKLFWQVDPRTHKLTFDQNSAAAAAGIYFKRNEKLDRCAELFEAIRANTTGETHISICLQLAEVYEKMNKKAKRMEMFTESLRFMDEMLEKARGPERAMLQLQYSEVREKTEETDKQMAMINEARKFFASDAEKGNPVAAFYVDLVDKKLAGEPFPDARDIQDRMTAFVKEHATELRAMQSKQITQQAVAQGIASAAPDEDEEVDAEEGSVIEPENIAVTTQTADSEAASDFLRAMIKNSGMEVTATPTYAEESSDDDSEETEDSSDSEESEADSAETVAESEETDENDLSAACASDFSLSDLLNQNK